MKKNLSSIFFIWSLAVSPVLAQLIGSGIRITRQDVLNSPAPETNIALTANRLTMYFSSSRGGNWWNQQDDSDIYYAIRLDTLAPWSKPLPLPTPINDELNQDEVYISPDGSTLTYQRWSHDWALEGGPYFETTRIGNRVWQDPKALGGEITEFFTRTGFRATDGMTRLRDGSIIFAAGPDFKQPMDLFYSKRSDDGDWQKVVPLLCNTKQDERSVFLAADGKTLYFASNRPGGKGGLDVYRLELREDGSTGGLLNLGAPVNTNRDEYGFVIHNEQEAYFVRDGDIYRIDNPDLKWVPEKPLVEPEPATQPVPATPPVLPNPGPDPIPVVVDSSSISSPVHFEKPNNVIFLLDVSHSMDEPDKLPLMLGSIRRILPSLRKEDLVTLISFATAPRLHLNGVAGDQQKFITQTLDILKAGGKTEGKKALQLAFNCANAHYIQGGNNVVVMATDGKMDRSDFRALMVAAAKKEIRLVMFVYGSSTSDIERPFQELTKITNGWLRYITRANIDSVLQEALLATLRKQ